MPILHQFPGWVHETLWEHTYSIKQYNQKGPTCCVTASHVLLLQRAQTLSDRFVRMGLQLPSSHPSIFNEEQSPFTLSKQKHSHLFPVCFWSDAGRTRRPEVQFRGTFRGREHKLCVRGITWSWHMLLECWKTAKAPAGFFLAGALERARFLISC